MREGTGGLRRTRGAGGEDRSRLRWSVLDAEAFDPLHHRSADAEFGERVDFGRDGHNADTSLDTVR